MSIRDVHQLPFKRQADKVKALVEAGVARLQVMEQLGISKAS